MTTISKKEVHKFLDKHPDIPFSAAKFEYSLYLEPEAVEYANAISEKILGESEEDLHSKRMIEQAETTEELLKLMRKPLSGGNRRRLRRKERICQYSERIFKIYVVLSNWVSRRCRNDSDFDERNRTSGKNVSPRNICTRSDTCYSGTCCQIS